MDVERFRYVPKGGGSYHWIADEGGGPKYFVTVDDLDIKPWTGRTPDPTFDGLETAYEAAWSLHHEAGLAFVVPPLRSPEGSVIVRLSDRYSMALFPYVEGNSGNWGDPLTEQDRTSLLQDLDQLHQVTPGPGIQVVHRPLDLPERPFLAAALDELNRCWEGGPLSEPARQELARHAQNVTGWLDQLDVLARRLEDEDEDNAVTHGEPHPGNLIHTPDGIRLIDWDTLSLAPPARDLWMLEDGAPGAVAEYKAPSGRGVSDTGIDFYRLSWTLCDIASFAHMIRSPHEDTEWIRKKWEEFQILLTGAPSAPFGVSR